MKRISLTQLLRQILFLYIPTIFVVYILIYTTSNHFPLFDNCQHLSQTIYFTSGLLIAGIFYSFRLRFLPSFITLLLLFAGAGFFIDNFALGEFDLFFLSMDFLLFRILFITGWVCGWGFSRTKYFPAIFSTLLLSTGVIVTALSGETNVGYILKSFMPVLVYSFYIIFMNELLRNTDETELRSWTKPVKGFLLYSAAMALVLFVTLGIFQREIKTLEVKWVEETIKDDNKNSLYDMLPDSSIQMKDAMQVNDNLNRNAAGQTEDIVLFVAYIDNFFYGDDNIPNPLYFVSRYLTTFDEYTETFEADTLMPYNDLFSPDPSSIPLYFTAVDQCVIENGMSQLHRKTVEAEVYKIKISPGEYTAPSTAFYCQPIAVKNDEFTQYTSAYRAKMWVSDLNSVYFVYNNTDKNVIIQNFQEQRFNMLRTVKNFNDVDTAFINYYTKYPSSSAYDTVRAIAQTIVGEAKAKTPVDKILAIRDYFMQTGESGKNLYRYSDIATSVPPGGRILNFLLNDHTGNCTYYAGSTLLLLRACGIPSRIATGYATVDRSSNNKGWYWIYNKQAHAWVQVFFPEYGWLDFDTTFGDSEQSEAPGTDGTPPLDPQKAWFAATGDVLEVDTIRKSMQFNMKKLVYFDREYPVPSPRKLKFDVANARFLKDSISIKLRDIKEGDTGLAISFARMDDVVEPKIHTLEAVFKKLPSPVLIDEFRVDSKPEEPEPEVDPSIELNKRKARILALVIILSVFAIILAVVMVLSIPYLIFSRYSRRAKRISDPKKEAYYPYRAATFLMYQMGYFRNELTPLQYAGKIIDKELGTRFEAFTATYLKVKYANQELTSDDSQRILTFFPPFEQSIKLKFTRKERFLRFINIYNTLEFYTRPRRPD